MKSTPDGGLSNFVVGNRESFVVIINSQNPVLTSKLDIHKLI